MNIGIINIGDELLAGKILNTNQFEIARLAAPLGHRISYGLVVGDDVAAIGRALSSVLGRPGLADSGGSGAGPSHDAGSWPRVEILILTGGLGPTRDDLTRQAVADYLGGRVSENAEALAWLADFLGKSPEDMPWGQRVQAAVPEGTDPLRNPAGTACGFRFRVGPTLVYAFPGVPRELEAMAGLHLLPELAGDSVLLEKGVWTWGWSEGAQRQALEGLDLPPALDFSSLPGERGVRISMRLLAMKSEQARREAELQTAWNAMLAAIPEESLVDRDGRSLPAAVFSLLESRSSTLSVAESCTGGGLGSLLTETPGSSAVFHRGFLTYSNQAKVDLLDVPEDVLKTFGAVSEEVVRAMALGCLKRSGADYACAITGIAGPDGGTEEKPVGTVWIAVAAAAAGSPVCHARRYHFRGDRQAIRQRSCYSALNQLRLFILGNPL